MNKDKINFHPIEIDRVDDDDWLWEDSDFEIDVSEETKNDEATAKKKKKHIFERKDSIELADIEAKRVAKKQEKEKTFKSDFGKTMNTVKREEMERHEDNIYFKEKNIKDDDEIKEETKNILKNMAAKMEALKNKRQGEIVQNVG